MKKIYLLVITLFAIGATAAQTDNSKPEDQTQDTTPVQTAQPAQPAQPAQSVQSAQPVQTQPTQVQAMPAPTPTPQPVEVPPTEAQPPRPQPSTTQFAPSYYDNTKAQSSSAQSLQTQPASAGVYGTQTSAVRPVRAYEPEMRAWFNFQLSEMVGLNRWNPVGFVNSRLPRPLNTDLRVGMNVLLTDHVGFFADLGLGLLPGPKKKGYQIEDFPTPRDGAQYYPREILSDNSCSTPSATFRLAGGLFAKFAISSKVDLQPCMGVGLMTMQLPAHSVMLKEQNVNIQYLAQYKWFYNDDTHDRTASMGYVTGRLNFLYAVCPRTRLIFALQYDWIFTPANFYTTFTNDFNSAINNTSRISGNNMKMIGLSFGVAIF